MYFIIIGCVFLFGTGILMYAMRCASGKTNRTENDLKNESRTIPESFRFVG